MSDRNEFKRIIKKVLVPLLFRSGYYSRTFRRRENNRCLILMYHRIDSDRAHGTMDRRYGISRQNFEKQMKFLREYMTPIPLSFLAENLQNRLSIPPKAVVVTFDDGYADNYFNAYPILKKYRIPATIFLTTGYIGTDKRFWWDQLRMVVRQNPELPSVLKKNKSFPPYLLSQWFSAKPYSWRELEESLITHIWRNQSKSPNYWISLLGAGSEKDFRADASTLGFLDASTLGFMDDHALLTWEQVNEMSCHNLDFGSHTVSHPNLACLSSQKVEEELRVSKRALENHLGRSVEGFAYPIGKGEHFNTRIRDQVHEAGFQYACTAQSGCIFPGKGDILSLNRISPPDSLPYFVRDLSHYLSLPYPSSDSLR